MVLFKYLRIITHFIIPLFLFSLISNAISQQIQPPPTKKCVRILSIDGGGIRGVIPATVLNYIESRLVSGRRIADCFDIIGGTSTGGIIALLLTTPDQNNHPKYSTKDICYIYEEFGKNVFSQSLWQFIKSGNGWWGPKYASESLEEHLKIYFGEVKLRNVLSNVIIPAYEIELDKTFFFKSSRARREINQDIYITDLARATSAAPTYFTPAIVKDCSQQRTLHLIDGGIAVNNPTLAATVYAVEIYGPDIDFFIVSLGTGTNYGAETKNISNEDVKTSGLIGWAHRIVPMMMYAVNDITNYEMRYVFNHSQRRKYYRFQPILESENIDMDNADLENIKILKQHAEDLILQQQEELSEIIQILNMPKE